MDQNEAAARHRSEPPNLSRCSVFPDLRAQVQARHSFPRRPTRYEVTGRVPRAGDAKQTSAPYIRHGVLYCVMISAAGLNLFSEESMGRGGTKHTSDLSALYEYGWWA